MLNIAHGGLQSKTQTTRDLMAKARDRRGLLKRYGPPAWTDAVDDDISRMHDVGLMMHPRYSNLMYIKTMVKVYSHRTASPALIDRRVKQVKNKILHLFQELVMAVLRGNSEDDDDGQDEGGAAASAAAVQ